MEGGGGRAQQMHRCQGSSHGPRVHVTWCWFIPYFGHSRGDRFTDPGKTRMKNESKVPPNSFYLKKTFKVTEVPFFACSILDKVTHSGHICSCWRYNLRQCKLATYLNPTQVSFPLFYWVCAALWFNSKKTNSCFAAILWLPLCRLKNERSSTTSNSK